MANLSGAPKVLINEKDLSARARSARGAYAMIVVPSNFGSLVPTLCNGADDFLAKFTVDGTVRVGDDLAFYEALNHLRKAGNLWVIRAQENAKYGGAFLRRAGSAEPNGPVEFGFTDPALYSLDTNNGRPNTLNTTFTVDASAEALSVSAEFLAVAKHADAVRFVSDGDLPSPLRADRTYYVVLDASLPTGRISVSETVPPTVDSGDPITTVTITAQGTGSHSIEFVGKSLTSQFTVVGAPTDGLVAVGSSFESAAKTGTPVQLSTTKELPSGLFTKTTYYLIASAGGFKLATSAANATAGTFIPLTNQGLGDHTVRILNAATYSAFTADLANDSLTIGAPLYEILKTGDQVEVASTGTMPTGLVINTGYFVIKSPTARKIQLAATLNDANSGTAIDISTPGTGTLTLEVQGLADEDAANLKSILLYTANPGVWASRIGVKVTNYETNRAKVKEPNAFLLEVFKDGLLVESFLCSRNPNAKDARGRNLFIENVLEGSLYLRAISNPAVPATVRPLDQLAVLPLAGGHNGNAVTDATMARAVRPMYNKDTYPLLLVQDGGWTTPAFQQALIDLCEVRGDCGFIFSCPFESQRSQTNYLNDLVHYKQVELNSASNYGGIYAPHLKALDTMNNRNLWLSPSGYVCGQFAETFQKFYAWTAVGGNERGRLNVLDVYRAFDESDQNYLYDNNINPIVWKHGEGIRIWGQKTLQQRPTDLDRMNARFTLLAIKPPMQELLEQFLFENAGIENDVGTRALVKARVEGQLAAIKANGGLYDYKVICDSSNNSGNDIENNTMRVWVLVKITKTIEYIPVEIGVTPYSVSFELAESLL